MAGVPVYFGLISLLLGLFMDDTVSIDCNLPEIRDGFAKCWKYRIVEEDDPVETEVVEVIRNVVQYTQRLLGNGTTIRISLSTPMPFSTLVKKKVKKCQVDVFPFSESLFPTSGLSLYILDVAHGGYNYSNDIVCRWNVPARRNLNYYILLQDIDIQYGGDKCVYDNLTIDLPNIAFDPVVCGSNISAIPPTLINRPYSQIGVTFRSDSNITGTGFKLLILPFLGGSKRSVQEEITTPCLCPEVPSVEKMCPHQYLLSNPVYPVWKSVQDRLRDRGYLHPWGFSGFKGCLGVEFFKGGVFVPPTPEECQHMTFGMSEAEIQNFAQLEFVEKFFLEPLSKLKEGDGYCSISMVPSRPNNRDLTVLSEMLKYGDAGIAKQYANYSNPFVRNAAKIISKGSTVPVFSPVRT